MGISHQRGWVEPRGKKWYGFFRQAVQDPVANERKQKKEWIILGLKSKMSKREAQSKLQAEIAKQTGRIGEGRVMQDSSVTFGWFVLNRYIPLKEAASWKEETAKVKKHIIQCDLIDDLGEIPMDEFDKLALQVHLNKLSKTRSRDTVLQIRAYMRDIFVEAVDQDFLSKDPGRKVKVPAELRETDKTILTWEQLQLALSHLASRDRVIVELDMTNALRPEELFGLRWKCFNPEDRTMRLMETVYRGRIRPWGKTKKSLGVVHLSEACNRDLLLWRSACKDPSPEAFIFPGRCRGRFMNTDSYRKRILHKLAKDLGLPKLTFQVIRRTMATLAQKKGTVKEVQGYLRHSRASTTTDVYMQQIPGTERTLVEALSEELRKPPAQKLRKTEIKADLPQIAPKPDERASVSC